MKMTINGKRYNSDTCEILAEFDHYSYSNNYSGTSSLLLARDGTYLICRETNGQDCYLYDNMYVCGDPVDWLQGIALTDAQESRLVELGLIELI